MAVRKGTAHRWHTRPVAARIVRWLALALPIGGAAIGAAGVGSSAGVPAGPATGAWVAHWTTLVVAAAGGAFVAERVATKLMQPLAALLELALLFPDRAPSRVRMAIHVGSVRRLQRNLAQTTHPSCDPAHAAVAIVELMVALQLHDPGTRSHSERTLGYTDLLARQLELPDGDRERLAWAALLHDIGKLQVCPRLLNKRTAPDLDDWEAIRGHPIAGGRLVAPLREFLGDWARAVPEHHERWDGSGYPQGLVGEEISMAARIVSVADAFEAMTSQRPYQNRLSLVAARREVAANAGSQFDPAVVTALLEIPAELLHNPEHLNTAAFIPAPAPPATPLPTGARATLATRVRPSSPALRPIAVPAPQPAGLSQVSEPPQPRSLR